MKKTLISLIALALSGAGLHAQESESVTSVNAVGMVKIDVVPNGLTFVALPFYVYGENASLDEIIGDQLTGGTTYARSDNIVVWDSSSNEYKNFYKYSGSNQELDGKWFYANTTNPADINLSNGSGFWVISRRNHAQELILSGEVPSESVSKTFTAGLTQAGLPYPVSININSSDFALALSANGGGTYARSDNLILWDEMQQQYVNLYLGAGLTGDDAELNGKWMYANTRILADITLGVGDAFWFSRRSLVSINWDPVKSYDWP